MFASGSSRIWFLRVVLIIPVSPSLSDFPCSDPKKLQHNLQSIMNSLSNSFGKMHWCFCTGSLCYLRIPSTSLFWSLLYFLDDQLWISWRHQQLGNHVWGHHNYNNSLSCDSLSFVEIDRYKMKGNLTFTKVSKQTWFCLGGNWWNSHWSLSLLLQFHLNEDMPSLPPQIVDSANFPQTGALGE